MNKANLWKLIASIALCQSAGIVGSFFTIPAIGSWYMFLNKPSFSPPNWVFSPAWLTLYTLMGIALYLVWTSYVPSSWKRKVMAFFIAHLAVNAGWSIVFFGLHNIALAFVVIIVLFVMIIFSIRIFYSVNRLAAHLLWPYLAWVSFATVLNYYLMVLN